MKLAADILGANAPVERAERRLAATPSSATYRGVATPCFVR
ncbi:MAG: hypothetical protein ABI190_04055 [Casimicrobiaceae bacterium]